MTLKNETKGSEVPVSPALTARAKAGDQGAFTELYEITSPAVYRAVRSMVQEEDLAWDIVQESYIRAFRSLDKLEANEAFLPWLRRIVVNETARATAARRPLCFSELSDEDEEALSELPDTRTDSQPELALDRQECTRLVREILADLPEQQNVIVGMRYYEDLSIREIGELLTLTPGTVKTQLHRGRKHVEERVRALEKQGIKLYGLSPMAFLVALLRRLEPAAGAERTAMRTILANAPVAAGGAGGSVTVTAMTAGQHLLHGLGAKLATGLLCAALVGGGVWAGSRALRQKGSETLGNYRPTEQVTEPYSVAQTDPIQLTTEPVETESAVIVPAVTEPEVTEPEATEAPLPETLSGDCGENLSWRFDPETGTLTIEGSGEMNDYYLEGFYPEWASLLKRIRSIELPEGLTSIGGSAFEYCTALTEVTIPDSVTSIGSAAFNSCSSLTAIHVSADNPYYCSVDGVLFDKEQTGLIQYPCGKQDASYVIPEGVRHVSHRAFAGCKYLKEATIPASLLYIEQYVLPFDGCESLTDILVAPTNMMFSSLDGVLYDKSQTSLLEYPCGKQDASCVLPNGLQYIGCDAFGDCTFLREITMPDTVEQIEDYAFSRCTGLTNVRFSKGLVQIGFCAFEGCSALTEVTLSDQVAEIKGMAFNGCTSLDSYQVAPGNPNFCTQDGVLFDREKTTLLKYPAGKRDASYEIPAGVTEIALRSFEDSTYLTELTIPDSVTTIGGLAFQNCTALTGVTIPRGVESVGHYAFRNCTALTSVILPEGLTTVDSEAFLDCISLTEVTIPSSVTDISYYAFGYRDLDIGFQGANWGLKEAAAKVEGFTIYGQPGSEAQRYAEENGFAFVQIS